MAGAAFLVHLLDIIKYPLEFLVTVCNIRQKNVSNGYDTF